MNEYIVAVDIAFKHDSYAELVLRDVVSIQSGHESMGVSERVAHFYQVVWLKKAERLRYEQMEESTLSLIGHAQLTNNCDLIVDGTGVGDPVVENLRKRGAYPLSVIFTSGGTEHDVFEDAGHVFGQWADALSVKVLKEKRVPKRNLVACGQRMLEQRRFVVGKKLGQHRQAFLDQLNGFRGIVNDQTKRIKFEAELEELHTDFVVCFLMAAWWSEKTRPIVPERELSAVGAGRTSWEPMDVIDALAPKSPEEYGPHSQGVQGWR